MKRTVYAVLRYRIGRIIFILFLWWLNAGSNICVAQLKNITITVYKQEDGGVKKAYGRVRVCGFYNINKGKEIHRKCLEAYKNNSFYDPKPTECNEVGVTDHEGICTLPLPLSGAVLILPDVGEPLIKSIGGVLSLSFNCKGLREMKQVSKTVTISRPTPPQVPNACGNRLEIGPYYYRVSAEITDDKSRMIISPLVRALEMDTLLFLGDKEPEEKGDTVGFLRPFVKDGVQFHKANVRRMGFDETRDPLYVYRDSTFMHSHKEDSMRIHFVLEPVDRQLRYKVDAIRALGINTASPYRKDSICLTEGYVNDPMRFLDFSMIEYPIDRTRYVRQGKAEMTTSHEKLDLKFVVGEARLDPSDTLNFKQLNQLKDNLARYTGLDAGITGAVIHGYASPDGGLAVNERLCRERAEYLRSELGRFPALQEARNSGQLKTTYQVATWMDVANQLEIDSLKEEAAGVRAILGLTKDMRRQEEAIRRLPYWGVIEENILPRLRMVDIEYVYYTNRVKTREEIWNLYQTDPEYHSGKKQMDYEFYQLLDMLKDPGEKEVIALAAYKSVKDYGGERPWPLAAYELAQCYSARGVIDTFLLKPYINTNKKQLFFERRDLDGNKTGEYDNDEAIVTTHIKMLADAGAFASAYTVAHMVLPDVPKYKRLKLFLRCMNCEWDNEEVRDTVMASSYWNSIVMNAAQYDEDYWRTARFMLDDASKVDQTAPKTLYLKGQLNFKIDAPKHTTSGYQESNFVYDDFFESSDGDPYSDNYGDGRQDWGLYMIQCCLKDPSYLKILLFDGVFNSDYRKAFKAYWRKLQKNPALAEKVLKDLEVSAGKRDTGTSVAVTADDKYLQ